MLIVGILWSFENRKNICQTFARYSIGMLDIFKSTGYITDILKFIFVMRILRHVEYSTGAPEISTSIQDTLYLIHTIKTWNIT